LKPGIFFDFGIHLLIRKNTWFQTVNFLPTFIIYTCDEKPIKGFDFSQIN